MYLTRVVLIEKCENLCFSSCIVFLADSIGGDFLYFICNSDVFKTYIIYQFSKTKHIEF